MGSDGSPIGCVACGEQNAPDSRFCKFCGRALVPIEKRPSVARDPRNRLLLVLVLVLMLACVGFGLIGLFTSKAGLFRGAPAGLLLFVSGLPASLALIAFSE